jgi:hypothetical protein
MICAAMWPKRVKITGPRSSTGARTSWPGRMRWTASRNSPTYVVSVIAASDRKRRLALTSANQRGILRSHGYTSSADSTEPVALPGSEFVLGNPRMGLIDLAAAYAGLCPWRTGDAREAGRFRISAG